MANTPRKKPVKGQVKSKVSDDPEKNPLIRVENKDDFKIWTDNILDNPSAMIFKGYENVDISADGNIFDTDRVDITSELIVTLRYYEYLCVAKCNFRYLIPIMDSGMDLKDIFDMLKHSLKTRLLMNVPSFETVIEIEIKYSGKVKY